MALFVKKNNAIEKAVPYSFKNEEDFRELLFLCPEIIFNIPQLDLIEVETAVKIKEFPTSRGKIDLLIITQNADIILIETKLIRNPESIRTVVAQTVDYIKAITVDEIDKFIKIADGIGANDKFISILKENIIHGNICGIIVGDDIHQNLLGLVDSIQSAPHLAFHINLVKITAHTFDNNLYISAAIVESTKEIERSVIRIDINPKTNKISIDSTTPAKEGKGAKPILSWDEYINNVAKHRNAIINFRNEWKNNIEDSINMGVTGFSAGIVIADQRVPIQLVYDDYLKLLSEGVRRNYGISDNVYNLYKKEIEKLPDIYDKHLISNKVTVYFSELDDEQLKIVFNAAIICANALREEYEKSG
jgi:hypothetical protein